MKKQIVIVASVCLVIGLVVIPGYPQAGGVLQARIPFKFTVLEKTLAAGDYMMTVHSHQLKIEDGDGRIVATVLVNYSGRSSDKKGQMIFHCYQDRCFLAEVWPPTAYESGCALLTSRAEANLAKEESGKYFAILGAKPQK